MPVLSAVKRLSLASISSVSLSSPNKPAGKKHDQPDSAFSRQSTSAAATPGNKMVSTFCLRVRYSMNHLDERSGNVYIPNSVTVSCNNMVCRLIFLPSSQQFTAIDSGY